MWDRVYRKFCSERNLGLALLQLQTASNLPYKNYYREILQAYSLSGRANLGHLSQQLRTGLYRPSRPVRLHMPTSSGLQRPITLMHLDDLIVYQAMANTCSADVRRRRKMLEYGSVFSNVLNRDPDRPEFFFQRWRVGYRRFLATIAGIYQRGNQWVGHFDLAAFYETVDHGILVNSAFPGSSDLASLARTCLMKWATDGQATISHGLPQGPLSSSFFAEVYLLPIDEMLTKHGVLFVRYVDDIKMFGTSRDEVLRAVLLLDSQCRRLGLVPHSGKHQIIRAASVEDATGRSPSLSASDTRLIVGSGDEAYTLLCAALDKQPSDISLIRYILKTAGRDDKILDLVFDKMSDYPELCGDFCGFLENYYGDRTVGQRLLDHCLRGASPYSYVEGMYWGIVGDFALSYRARRLALREARRSLRDCTTSPDRRIGIYRFMCTVSGNAAARWIERESFPLVQMIALSYLAFEQLDSGRIRRLLEVTIQQSSYEAGLACIGGCTFGLRKEVLASLPPPKGYAKQVLMNSLGRISKIDPIGEILGVRFDLPYYNDWRSLFVEEYEYANELLFLSEQCYASNRTQWVSYVDVFNDVLVKKWIGFLKNRVPLISWPSVIGRDGSLVDLGILLDTNNQLSRHFPKVCDGLRRLHTRRNATPMSHAYEKKTALRTQLVRTDEQRQLRKALRVSYSELVHVLTAP